MKTSRRIVGILAAAVALMLVPAASAQADPFTMSIDNAIIDLGSISAVRAIDSSLEPPDPPATLSGDLTGGTVNVPKANFVFPTKSAEISTGITADIDMEANEDFLGNFDSETGKLVMAASLKATVAVLGSTCVISPIVLEFSTDSVNPYLGQPFESGIEGNGVISDDWASLPPVTGGGSCGIVSQLISGPGGLALSHGVYDFQTCETEPSNPLCEVVTAPKSVPVLNSAPPSPTDQTTATFTFAKGNGETQPVDGFECSLDNAAFEPCGTGESGTKEYTGLAVGDHSFAVKAVNTAGSGEAASHTWTITEAEKCPDGWTGTPPNCVEPPPEPEAKLGALKIQPAKKAVKRGKKVVIKVRVRNVGDAAATGVKVCVNAPKKRIQVKKCLRPGKIPVGGAKLLKFKVKAKRKKGKAILRFKATSLNAGTKNGKSTIRVK